MEEDGFSTVRMEARRKRCFLLDQGSRAIGRKKIESVLFALECEMLFSNMLSKCVGPLCPPPHYREYSIPPG